MPPTKQPPAHTFDITVESPAYQSFRAAKVRSMFNVSNEQGASHRVNVALPLDEKDWSIGLIVGPSGSGKTTLGRHLFGGGKLHQGFEWARDQPLIDQIGAGLPFEKVTGALAAVGLGTVPSWLRPQQVLSMGEQFRADLARVIIEQPEEIVLDEFTSVVDRQIAQIGAAAFAKSWRRTSGKCVALSCHYDIIDWLQPDWVLDTEFWEFKWRCLRRRPNITLDVYETSSGRAWSFFKPHHYLKLDMPIAAVVYIAEVDGKAVGHLCVSTFAALKSARFARLVIKPEWQGAGIGVKFLEYVAQRWLDGENRYSKKMTGIINTSHPGLIIALRRSSKWVAITQQIGGSDKKKKAQSLARSAKKRKARCSAGSGYGGHLRAIAGFRYVGERAV